LGYLLQREEREEGMFKEVLLLTALTTQPVPSLITPQSEPLPAVDRMLCHTVDQAMEIPLQVLSGVSRSELYISPECSLKKIRLNWISDVHTFIYTQNYELRVITVSFPSSITMYGFSLLEHD